MLDSIYHMTITLKSHFWCKNVIIFCHYVRNVVMNVNMYVSGKSINH